MKKALLMLSVALSLLSCDNSGPEPVPSAFLKVEVFAPYSGVDQWIFATNENGELMDAKRVEDGVELSTTTEYASFDLSILNVDYYKREIFGLTTYRNFDQSEIVLRNSYYQPPAKSAGQARVKITDIPEDKIYQNISISSSLNGGSSEGNWTYSKTSYSIVKLLGKQLDKVVVVTSKSGTPSYHVFDNVTDGDALSVSYADLTPHQNLITISPPGLGGGSVRLEGLADNDQSTFSLGSDEGSVSTPLQIGTVPGFTRYKTTINSYRFTYTKKGAALSSYTAPQYSLGVSDTTIAKLSASLSLSHDYQYAEWHRTDVTNGSTINGMNVYVYSDKSSAPTVNYEIPSIILREHPSVSLSKLAFYGTRFYRSMGTYSYSDFLAEKFNGKVKSDYELYEFYGR